MVVVAEKRGVEALALYRTIFLSNTEVVTEKQNKLKIFLHSEMLKCGSLKHLLLGTQSHDI